jgi:glucose/arabinose dehydrogenase
LKRLHLTILAAIFALGLSSCAPTAQAQQQESEQRQSQQAQQQSQESYTDFPTSDGDEPSEFNLTRTPDPSKIKVPDGYKVEVLTTDLSYATDITFGPNGETYVSEAGRHFYGKIPENAPPARILQIMPDGSKNVIYDNNVPVEAIRSADKSSQMPEGLIPPMEGITYNPDNGLIYVAHRTRVSTLNPQTGEFKTIIHDLPAWGIFHNTKIALEPGTGKIVFAVSSQGNAGVVDFPITRVASFYNKRDAREVPCEDVTLTGKNFNVENRFTEEEGDAALTGAFVPLGTETQAGQTIKGELICNSAFYRADPDGSNIERIAWGIRNAFHHAYSPDGRLIATNNSGNAIPPRMIFDDWETIYEIKEGEWYGWPDYYSSVPVTNDRFELPEDPDYPGAPAKLEFLLTEETRNRLLKGRQAPPEPLARIYPHVATQGFVFGNESFGIPAGELLVAEFGTVQTFSTKGKAPGFRVSRVNLETGKSTPFMENKEGVRPASTIEGATDRSEGLERPLRLAFGPDGALYLVDWGVFETYPPKKNAHPNTGVVWKITRNQ